MKRFEIPENEVHILQTSPSPEPQKSNFDISKLLQILPKLNLNGIFNKQTSAPEPPQMTENFAPTVDFMREHNKIQAATMLESHQNMIKDIKHGGQLCPPCNDK